MAFKASVAGDDELTAIPETDRAPRGVLFAAASPAKKFMVIDLNSSKPSFVAAKFSNNVPD